ncbi:sulfotransferase domain-containing protein [Jiulongibacter sp. NS-SX5]|uniref:sulfotransferase domain-containing protein n=1 Tax=Jiulongibacter sp. NS-SX5 TaxID=3463854 RepID=UPI004059CD7C
MIEYGKPRDISPEITQKLKQTDLSDTEIYFHVGVERTGTKFLQKRIFPKYKSVHFINKDRYADAKEIILRKEHSRYLVSMELNLNSHFEVEVRDFLSAFPNAKIIMVMRPISGWVISHYKRIIKNGFNLTLEQFWSAKGESVFEPNELYYFPKIELLEKLTKTPPLYLLHPDLISDPKAFLRRIADYLGEPFNEEELDLSPVHKSYKERQLKALQLAMKYVNIARQKPYKNELRNRIYRLRVDLIRYLVIYLTPFIPKAWLKSGAFVSKEQKEQIKTFYQKDWQKVLEFVKER